MSNFIDPTFLQLLTHVMLTGAWRLTRLKSRILRVFPEDKRLLSTIVESVWQEFSAARPNAKLLATFLRLAITAIPHETESRSIRLRRDLMRLRWPVAKLATSEQLAAWLDISLNHLEWLADLKNWTTAQSETKLRHYTLIRLPRKRGKSRILEVPKPRLKAIQCRILHEILDLIPPHEAAHGFRRARSIVTYVSPHVGHRIVLRFDLRDFFASVTVAKVGAIFRAAGYPVTTAKLLAGLCTTRTPNDVAVIEPHWRARHLPQGAPTSPALANLAAYRLDIRLQALAQTLGASYTRYADDIAFSGDVRLDRAAKRVQTLVAVIAAEEGFELNFRKTRFMREGVRQQLAGVVINARPNVRRADFDELKAILHNCARFGPTSQNRADHADFRRHLEGRIAHVKSLNPARGAQLKEAFERIAWNH